MAPAWTTTTTSFPGPRGPGGPGDPGDRADVARALREQALWTVERSQALTVQATRAWGRAVSALPGSDRTALRRARAARGMEAASMFAIDLAADLVVSQRRFVRALSDALDPATRA